MNSYLRIQHLFSLLNTEEILKRSKKTKTAFTRKRKMTLVDILQCIILKRGNTLAVELRGYFKTINKPDNQVTKQAFNARRLTLNPEVFIYLNQQFVKSIYETSKYATFKDYLVLAVDGSVIEIPENPETIRSYGGTRYSKKSDEVLARARVSGIYDVLNNIMIDASLNHYDTSEGVSARENLKVTHEILDPKAKKLMLFDRGYASLELLLTFEKYYPDSKFVIRAPKGTYYKEREALNSKDGTITLKITRSRIQPLKNPELIAYAKEIGSVKVRVVTITLDSGEEEYLFTNLSEDEVSTSEMGALYFKRWGIETGYDKLKNKLCIENFSGYKKITIEQDFYAQILLFNMIEDMRNDANIHVKTNKNKTLKYDYKINTNVLVGIVKQDLLEIMLLRNPVTRQQRYESFIQEISKHLVPIRPKRSFERTKKQRKAKHKCNLRKNS